VKQEVLVPIDSPVENWDQTFPPAQRHYAVVDEGLEPPGPNDNDYVNSLTVAQQDQYKMPKGVSNKLVILNYVWQFRFKGDGTNPGIKFWLKVADVIYAQTQCRVFTGGRWSEGQVRWNGINIPAADWYAGQRIIIMETFVSVADPPPNIKEDPLPDGG
jgi:hypothetical protein